MREKRSSFGTELIEEHVQGGVVAARAGPHQAAAVMVDDHDQIAVRAFVRDLVEWLHTRNAAQSHPVTKGRFYGLDLYSLQDSIESVIGYLDQVDPPEARRARERYACFDHVGAEGRLMATRSIGAVCLVAERSRPGSCATSCDPDLL